MKLRTLFAVACAAFMAMPAYAELKIGANVETNTTVSSSSVDSGSTTTDKTKFDNDGRVEFAMEARVENEAGLFAAGKGCGEIKVDGGFGECDVWFSLGTPSFAMKVGHWEAEDMFAKGEDVYIAEVPGAVGRYEMNKIRGRNPNGFGVVVNFSDALKLDARTAFDTGSADFGAATGVDVNKLGARPVLVYSASAMTVKVGGEYLMITPQDGDAKGEITNMGFGAMVEAKAGNMTFGVTGAMLTVDGKNVANTTDAEGNVISTKEVDADEVTTTSAGAYMKMPIGEADQLGLAGGYTTEDVNDSNHMYGYVSYVHQLPVEGAKVKFGASFANATDIGGADDGTAFGARVRFNYNF